MKVECSRDPIVPNQGDVFSTIALNITDEQYEFYYNKDFTVLSVYSVAFVFSDTLYYVLQNLIIRASFK